MTAQQLAETRRCRRCPEDGGVEVARYPGYGPARHAVERAADEAAASGIPHHDHYDPDRDAFVVVRHAPGA